MTKGKSLCDVLNFRGTWRSYQARVLDRADEYFKDGHMHIVAAPGSGKTTLGIELIRRVGRPVLILAPSITIREQWKDRIVSAFLDSEENPDRWISQSLKKPAPIMIATYQALHSAMTRTRDAVEYSAADIDSDESDVAEEANRAAAENVDYSSFDLLATMAGNGSSVLCLDECHHLRSEWWKALEEYKASMSAVLGEMTTISLTATPPYDSNITMWQRYIDMCGEIDEEITVPELVKEGSLCPHQDFVYFNYPTAEETDELRIIEERNNTIVREMLDNELFAQAVIRHKVFTGEKTVEEMLECPANLSALIIFMREKNQPVPNNIRKVMGVRVYPKMNTEWMQILLAYFLGKDGTDFGCDEDFRESIRHMLRRRGCLEKGKVALSMNTSIEKMLISSKGKLNSVLDIAASEYESIGSDLRMLVLTDYIRREYERTIGSGDSHPNTLGVLPYFEVLRTGFRVLGDRAPKLAVLCGTVVIIPGDSVEILKEIAGPNADKLSFSQVGSLPQSQYVKVNASGSVNFLTGSVTELFSRGKINIMIGTKSLLGEGWDSPCINSLILASFVGSFMLSNQMRGRAIRVMKGNPDKTSNIWHLVCIKPKSIIKKEEKDNPMMEIPDSEDWLMLERRMKHFLGLNYSEDIIEDGTDRLTCIHKPFSERNVAKTNEEMLAESRKRGELKQRWDRALTIAREIEIMQEADVPKGSITSAYFVDSLRKIILSVILFGLSRFICVSQLSVEALGFNLAGIALLAWIVVKFPSLLGVCSPYRRMKKMGECLIKVLKEQGHLTSSEHYKVEGHALPDKIAYAISLKGGTAREKELFAKCISEIFGVIDNQRYLLVHPRKKMGSTAYYCVPEIMANNKANAELFRSAMEKVTGKYKLVYTRSEEGRKVLLKARANAYANMQEAIATRRRVKADKLK